MIGVNANIFNAKFKAIQINAILLAGNGIPPFYINYFNIVYIIIICY